MHERRQVEDAINSVRAKVPEPILGHCDRQKSRGKLGIAPVRGGVCGACHLKMPLGHVAELRHKRLQRRPRSPTLFRPSCPLILWQVRDVKRYHLNLCGNQPLPLRGLAALATQPFHPEANRYMCRSYHTGREDTSLQNREYGTDLAEIKYLNSFRDPGR